VTGVDYTIMHIRLGTSKKLLAISVSSLLKGEESGSRSKFSTFLLSKSRSIQNEGLHVKFISMNMTSKLSTKQLTLLLIAS